MDFMKYSGVAESNKNASDEKIPESNVDSVKAQKLEPKYNQDSQDEDVKYLRQRTLQVASMQCAEISSGIGNNIQPIAENNNQLSINPNKQNGTGVGYEKSEDENLSRKPKSDTNLNVDWDRESKSAMLKCCIPCQRKVPMTANVEHITTHLEGCLLSYSSTNRKNHPFNLRREVYPKMDMQSPDYDTLVQQPERMSSTDSNADYNIRMLGCETAPYSGHEINLLKNKLEETLGRGKGRKLNASDERCSSYDNNQCQEEANYEEPELVDDENDPILQEQYFQILSKQFKENESSDNNTLNSYGTPSNKVIQSDICETLQDKYSKLAYITSETSENSKKDKTKSCKPSKPRKWSEHHKCSLCNLSMHISHYDAHVRMCQEKNNRYNKSFENMEETFLWQQELNEATNFKCDNEQMQLATGNSEETTKVENNLQQGGKAFQTSIQTNIHTIFEDKHSKALLNTCETSESTNTDETMTYRVSKTRKLEERRKCIGCNWDILIKYYDFHVSICKKRQQIYGAPIKNNKDQSMCQQALAKSIGKEVNANDGSQESKVAECQGEDNFEVCYTWPELVDDENDPYLQKQYFDILSMQFKKHESIDKNLLDSDATEPNTITQSDICEDLQDENSNLVDRTYETSKNSTKDETRRCKVSEPRKWQERRKCILCNLSMHPNYYDFHVKMCQKRNQIYRESVVNKEEKLQYHQEQHETVAFKCNNEQSKVTTAKIKETMEVENDDLKQERQAEEASYTNIQCNTLKTFQYLLKPCASSEIINTPETISYKETTTKLVERSKRVRWLQMLLKYLDSHKGTSRNDKQLPSASDKSEQQKKICQHELDKAPAFNSNNVQSHRKKPINVEESKMQQERQAWEATGARPREKDWKKKYFTCNKKNKGDPFGPAINYEKLTLQEKSDLLTKICGVVSNISGRPCKRSVRCPWHLDEERNALRRSLLTVPASDVEPNQAVNPGIPDTNNVVDPEGTVNYLSASSFEKSSECK